MAFPRGENVTDVFAVTTVSPTLSGFQGVCKIFRVLILVNVFGLNTDNGWTQSLEMDYIAWDEIPQGVQMGTYEVGTSSNQLATVEVPFTSPFTTLPHVFLTSRAQYSGESFAVTTANVSLTGFTANIYRVDANSGWSQV